MSYTVKKLPGEPILISVMGEAYDIGRDASASAQQLLDLLETLDVPVFLVADMREIRANFGDVVAGLGAATRGEAAVFRHPNIREVVVVTTSDLLGMAAKALGQLQYGGLRASVFETLDEALAYVRDRVAEEV
jgi:hypothetical protein